MSGYKRCLQDLWFTSLLLKKKEEENTVPLSNIFGGLSYIEEFIGNLPTPYIYLAIDDICTPWERTWICPKEDYLIV